MLSVRSLRHRYGDVTVLDAPDFQLDAGEHAVLLGPSGSGKTTLLHALAGILPPTEGAIVIESEDLYRPRRADRWRAARIGLVPQQPHLIGALSVLDNLRVAQRMVAAADTSAALAVLARLGLRQHAHKRPAQLSMGQQQRGAIARAVINRPRLLLADEPTSALDSANAAAALDLLFEAARQCDATLLVATHDARVRDRFGRVIELHVQKEPA